MIRCNGEIGGITVVVNVFYLFLNVALRYFLVMAETRTKYECNEAGSIARQSPFSIRTYFMKKTNDSTGHRHGRVVTKMLRKAHGC